MQKVWDRVIWPLLKFSLYSPEANFIEQIDILSPYQASAQQTRTCDLSLVEILATTPYKIPIKKIILEAGLILLNSRGYIYKYIERATAIQISKQPRVSFGKQEGFSYTIF